MKSLFPLLCGNDTVKDRIGTAILKDSLAHAYIIEGEDGCGKMFFARQIAAALSCEKKHDAGAPLPCGECNMCKKILASGSPDVTYLDKGDNKSINIESVRNIRRDAYLSASEANKKVYIIDGAETMTPQAQNALLIVLEEPPPDVVIMLLCESSTRLLTTVKSRAQTIRMSLFESDAIRDYLLTHSEAAKKLSAGDPEAFDALLISSGGCIGRALDGLDKKDIPASVKRRAEIEAILALIVNRGSYGAIRDKIFALSTKRQELEEQLKLLSLALRDLALIRRNEEVQLCFYTNREHAREIADRINMKTLLYLYDCIDEALSSLSVNANVTLTLTKLANDIKRNKQ